MDELITCTAFEGGRLLAAGPAAVVALAVKRAVEQGASPLVFDDCSGRQIDFDLRGNDADVAARLEPTARPAGRPKLGS